jgi:hypothetical protein
LRQICALKGGKFKLVAHVDAGVSARLFGGFDGGAVFDLFAAEGGEEGCVAVFDEEEGKALTGGGEWRGGGREDFAAGLNMAEEGAIFVDGVDLDHDLGGGVSCQGHSKREEKT